MLFIGVMSKQPELCLKIFKDAREAILTLAYKIRHVFAEQLSNLILRTKIHGFPWSSGLEMKASSEIFGLAGINQHSALDGDSLHGFR